MNTIWSGISFQSEYPKYQVLMQYVRHLISSNILKEGEKLPAVRDLSFDIKVTPGTVARAYKELVTEGVLDAGVGRGTFVKANRTPLIDVNVPIQFNLRYVRLADHGQITLLKNAMNRIQTSPQFEQIMLNIGTNMQGRLEQLFSQKVSQQISLGPFEGEDVSITAGAQNGVSIALNAVLQGQSSDAAVAVDDLSYGGFRSAAEFARCDVHGVSWDEEGPLPWSLEHLIQTKNVKAYLTSSEVQNPTIAKVSNARRVEISDLAKQHGLAIIEDDCYRFAEATGPSYRTLAPDNAWYVTSLSKVFSASLRLGIVVAPLNRSQIAQRSLASSVLRVSDYLYTLGAEVLSEDSYDLVQSKALTDIDTYLAETINRLGRFDISWQPSTPVLWIWLPKGWRTTSFCQAAEKAGVSVVSFDAFALRNTIAPPAVRICVNAEYGLAPYLAAIDKLAHLLENPVPDMTF